MKQIDRRIISRLARLCPVAVFAGMLTTGCSRTSEESNVAAAPPSETVEEMLEAFVDDFRRDPFADQSVTFGIRVDEEEWHVVVAGRPDESEPADVTLHAGFPSEPSFYYVADRVTLGKIYSGELNALTAAGRERQSDRTPLDFGFTEDFQLTPEALDHALRLTFHFWTRGFPEVIRFGEKRYTRQLHGGNATLLYYQEGFRSGWFQIEPGQHVNADPQMQTNPFPSLFIVTRGALDSRIAGVERQLTDGEAVYIGPGVSHEFWNSGTEPGAGILLMFGEGA